MELLYLLTTYSNAELPGKERALAGDFDETVRM
jgi:hypothetical protein